MSGRGASGRSAQLELGARAAAFAMGKRGPLTLFTRRVAALERALAPEPAKPPNSEINRELEDILAFTTDAELDLLEQLYRVAAAAGHDEPQGADRERVPDHGERA